MHRVIVLVEEGRDIVGDDASVVEHVEDRADLARGRGRGRGRGRVGLGGGEARG